MLRSGDDLGIILWNVIFLLVSLKLFGAKLGLLCANLRYPLIAYRHRYQVGIGEITVILGILLRAHRVGILFIVIPAPCLLYNALSLLDKLYLSLALALYRSGDSLKRVEVFHLGSGTEL